MLKGPAVYAGLRIGVRMNRRNVLGNQIEESKTIWIVLTGLIVSILQFVIYYFVGSNWLGLVLAGLCILLGGILVHFITGEQEELFAYLLIPCAVSGMLGLLIPQLTGEILPESSTVFIGGLLAWFIPVIYACIYTWAEGTSSLEQFSSFYKKAEIFFYIVYLGVLVYWFAVKCRIPEEEVGFQLIPFATFAAYVNGIISDTVPVQRLLEFLAERVILFLPYGFFIGMVCRKLHAVANLLLLLILPVVVELLQYILAWNSCDVDDMVFSFLGGLIGMMCFVVFNAIFQRTTGKNYDGSEVDRDYYGRRL